MGIRGLSPATPVELVDSPQPEYTAEMQKAVQEIIGAKAPETMKPPPGI